MRTLSLITILFFIVIFFNNQKLKAKDLRNVPLFENDETHAESDDFIGSFTMSITETKKGKPSKDSPVKINYYFKNNQVAFEPEVNKGQKTIMIYDLKDKMVTTLIDKNGEKTGMTMKMPKIKIEDKYMDDQAYTVTATDERKTIEGFACQKYLIVSKENSGYAWITKDVTIDYEKIASYFNVDQRKMKISGLTLQDIKGFAMEVYTESKKKEEAFEMKITNLSVGKLNEDIFDTSEYTITDMSSLMNFGGE